MKKGCARAVGISLLSLGVAVALVEGVAGVRVRRLRAERARLGNLLHTEIRGQGDPVVFLAGLPATTHFWQGAFDSLAKTRLIFVDALGFGRSPLPDVEYTLADHLGALRRTLIAQGATRRVTFVAGGPHHSPGAGGELASAISARVVETGDDHLSYPSRSAGRILAAMEAR